MARNTSKRKKASWRPGGPQGVLSDPGRRGGTEDIQAARLRVLHVLSPAPVGGAEQVVASLASGLGSRGHEVQVAALIEPARERHPFVQALDDADVAYSVLEVPSRAYLRERRVVRELIHEFKPDVVHTHGYRPDVVDGPVVRSERVPLVSTIHGFTGGDLKNRIYEYLHLRALRQHDAVIAVSAPLGEQLLEAGLHASRLHVVPNACVQCVDPIDRRLAREHLGIGDGRFVIGWVGRLSREKGPDLAIEAMALLKDLPAQLVFVGDGPMERELRERVSDIGLQGSIHFAGRVEEAARYYRAFDLVLLSSRTEGTPIVLLEAMETGTPVIATAVGGVPDVLTAREGLLVLPESPQGIAAAIRDVFERPGLAAERARKAQALLATEFHPDAWLDRYESIYERVVTDLAP